MIISSRTPEGSPNVCPVCGHSVIIEPSVPYGDAPCPHCGALLWFVGIGDDVRLFAGDEAERVRSKLLALLADKFGISGDIDWLDFRAWRKRYGLDSLDVVEIVMEIEELDLDAWLRPDE